MKNRKYINRTHNSLNNSFYRRIFLFLLLSLSIYGTGYSQEEGELAETEIYPIAVQAKPYGDSIVLRWAPSDPVTWRMAMNKGYTIHRVAYLEDSIPQSGFISEERVFPASMEELREYTGKKDKYMGIAVEVMYGDNFSLGGIKESNSFIDQIKKQHDIFTLRYFFGMFVADLSAEAADIMGLRFVDRDVEPGYAYEYMVICDTSTQAYAIAPGKAFVINIVPEEAYPRGLEATAGDRVIELKWNREQVYGYTSYYIERSDDGGKTYHRLNEEPYQTAFNEDDLESTDSMRAEMGSVLQYSHIFTDSVKYNYKDYYYRIIGIDAFADLSDPSPPIKTHAVDLTPPKPVYLDSAVNIKFNHIKISWSDKEQSQDLMGYFVARGNTVDGPFIPLNTEILDKNTFFYIDTTATALEANYYIVASVDTAENVSYSFPRRGFLIDSMPPEPPIGLEGKMDSLGNVAMKWDENQEEDLSGYRVFLTYDKNGPYNIITPYVINKNYLIHQVSTTSLDSELYFKVAAVDRNRNQSELSNAFTIYKPILVPPSPPVPEKIYIQNDKIVIDWIGSSSEGVWGYEIYRFIKGDKNSPKVNLIHKNLNSQYFTYVDTTAQFNTDYVYMARSVDSTGLLSKFSFPIGLNNRKSALLPSVENFKAISQKEGQVELSWDYRLDGEEHFFIIYRAEGDGPYRMRTSVAHDSRNYVDRQVEKGQEYKYRIEVQQNEDKLRSPKSDEVNVLIE